MSVVLELVDDKWVDPRKRHAPKPPSPEEIAENETARLSRRQRAKQGLAACQLAEARYMELQVAIGAVEAKKDELAAQHQQLVAPLQAEISAIEGRQIELIASKLPVNPNDEQRRGELLDELRQANNKLAEEIENQDRLLRQLADESRQVGMATVDKSDHTRTMMETASQKLRYELAVARDAAKWSEARLRSAQEKATEFGYHWNDILADATEAHAVYQQRVDQATAAVMSE